MSAPKLPIFHKLAKDSFDSKNYEKAETFCRDGLKIYKGDSTLTFHLCMSLSKSKDTGKLEEALKSMPTLSATHQPVLEVYRVWIVLAVSLSKWGELAEVCPKAIDLLKAQPSSPKVLKDIEFFEVYLKKAKENLPTTPTPKKAKSKGKEGEATNAAASASASASSATATATATAASSAPAAKSPLAPSPSPAPASASASASSDLLMGGGGGVDQKWEDPATQREGILSLWKAWMEDSFEPSFLLPRSWWDTWCAYVSLDWKEWEATYSKDPTAAITTGGDEGVGEGEGGEEGGGVSSSLSRSSSARVGDEQQQGGGEVGKAEDTTTPPLPPWILPPSSSSSFSPPPRPPAIPTHTLVVEQPGVVLQGHASKCHDGLRLTLPKLTPKEVMAVSSQMWCMLIPLYGCHGPSIERLENQWYPELMSAQEREEEEREREVARQAKAAAAATAKASAAAAAAALPSGPAPVLAASSSSSSSSTSIGSGSGAVGHLCSVCGAGGAARCVCSATFYCPKKGSEKASPCQTLAWEKGHNIECASLKAAAAARRAAEAAAGPNAPPSTLAALPPRPRPTKALASAQVGLTNLKNTCFMAASIQALVSVGPLTRYYLRGEHRGDINAKNPLGTKGSMATSFGTLVGNLWLGAPGTSVPPTEVLAEIRRFQDRFEGNAQHDAQEFLMFLVDGLHEDCNAGGGKFPGAVLRDMVAGEGDEAYGAEAMAHFSKLNDSLLCRLFYGTFKNTMRCPLCSARSLKFDPFNVLNLPIPPPDHHAIEVVLFTQPSPSLLSSPHAWAVPSLESPPEALALWSEVAENSIPPGCSRAFRYRLLFPATQASVSAEEVVARVGVEAGIPTDCLVIHPFSSTPTNVGLSYGGVGHAGGGGGAGAPALAPKPPGFYPFLSPHTQIPLPYPPTLFASQVAPPDWVRPRAPGEAPAADPPSPQLFSTIAEEFSGALEGALKRCADAAAAAVEASENAEKAVAAAATAAAAAAASSAVTVAGTGTATASGGSGAPAAAAVAAASSAAGGAAAPSAAAAAAAEALNATMSPLSPKLGSGGGGGKGSKGGGGGKWDDDAAAGGGGDPTSPSALAAAATAAALAAASAVTAASTSFPSATAATKAAYLSHRPPSHRLLVPLDFWVGPDGDEMDMNLFGEGPIKALLPEKAFTHKESAKEYPYKAMFTLVLSLSADTPLPILRMHAAAHVLPMLGGLAVWRKRLVAAVGAYKGEAATKWGRFGEGIPAWQALAELAARLPITDGGALLRRPKEARWLPSAISTPIITPTDCAKAVAGGVESGATTPAGAGASVGGELPPTLPPLGSPLDATPHTIHSLVTSALGACLLRGPALKKLLCPENFPTRFMTSDSYKATVAALESELDVSTLLRKFLSQESLDESNTWLCTGCGKRVSAEKTLELWDLPEFLVVNLKRYGTKLSKSGAFTSKKSEKRVNFPLMGWDVAPFLRGGGSGGGGGGASPPPSSPSSSSTHTPLYYDCVAVVNQLGNFKGGHYTAFVNKSARMEGRVTRDDEWIKFDDHKVAPMDKKAVVTDDAYIMIFAKRK